MSTSIYSMPMANLHDPKNPLWAFCSDFYAMGVTLSDADQKQIDAIIEQEKDNIIYYFTSIWAGSIMHKINIALAQKELPHLYWSQPTHYIQNGKAFFSIKIDNASVLTGKSLSDLYYDVANGDDLDNFSDTLVSEVLMRKTADEFLAYCMSPQAGKKMYAILEQYPYFASVVEDIC